MSSMESITARGDTALDLQNAQIDLIRTPPRSVGA